MVTIASGEATVLVTVAKLLPVFRSVTPDGTAMVAVFDTVPPMVAVVETTAETVYVSFAPLGRVTVVLKLPLPLAAGQVAPEPRQVQVKLLTFDGALSAITAPVTVPGPEFCPTTA